MADQTPSQHWAQVIRDGASDDGVQGIISAINARTRARHANQADGIVACVKIIGQVVACGGPEIAAEMRQGIIAMIDGYSMQVAVGEVS